jgi:hypothetical protein
MSSATPAVAQQASDAPQLKRELGVRDLTLFAVACVTAARWVPIAAHAGFASLTLWLLAGLLFLVPLTIAVAALVAKYPGAGGLYVWTREDFGPWNGFVSFWLYWIGIAFLFPTAALLYTKVGFSLLGPTYASLGENRYWLLGATLVLVWVGIGSNLFGLNVGKWTENAGAIATWAVGFVFVLVGWMVWRRRGFATAPHVVPSLQWGTISFWAAIAYAMSGMEGPGMMAGETHDPERTMRRAGWIASAFTVAFYVITTAALLVVLPPEKISELNGFVDVGNSAAELLRAPWLHPGHSRAGAGQRRRADWRPGHGDLAAAFCRRSGRPVAESIRKGPPAVENTVGSHADPGRGRDLPAGGVPTGRQLAGCLRRTGVDDGDHRLHPLRIRVRQCLESGQAAERAFRHGNHRARAGLLGGTARGDQQRVAVRRQNHCRERDHRGRRLDCVPRREGAARAVHSGLMWRRGGWLPAAARQDLRGAGQMDHFAARAG